MSQLARILPPTKNTLRAHLKIKTTFQVAPTQAKTAAPLTNPISGKPIKNSEIPDDTTEVTFNYADIKPKCYKHLYERDLPNSKPPK